MKVGSGIELVYFGRNRRVDLKRAEAFLDDLHLEIVLPPNLAHGPVRQATLAMKVTGSDVVIRPVEGVVEYHGFESLPKSRYFVFYQQVGEKDEEFTRGPGPNMAVCEKKAGGLHLSLYGLPIKKI